MSDEFLRVAAREINEELVGILNILNSCSDDSEMEKNASEIEQHMHKIKGLAPMMGKENIGNLAKSLDSILKKIVSGKKLDGFLECLKNSIQQMSMAMEKTHDLSSIQKEVSDLSLKILD